MVGSHVQRGEQHQLTLKENWLWFNHHILLTLTREVSRNSDSVRGRASQLAHYFLYFVNEINVISHEAPIPVLSRCWATCDLLSPCMQGAASPLNLSLSLCFKAGSEISEFCSFCICLLPLLAAVLPALQPAGIGVRAGRRDSQMQTGHEGTSVMMVIHLCTAQSETLHFSGYRRQ